MPDKVYVVTGPTATGKSAVGVRISELIGGEVVSADSMQVYRHMDIGTAKATALEMRGIPHHMIDVASPFENYSTAKYVEAAEKCCRDIISRGKTPVIVGGTGLYIESLILGRDFAPEANDGIREKYSAMYEELGGEELLERLKKRDPERAAKLHPNDKKRIVRAFEISESGLTQTEHDILSRAAPPRFNAAVIVLNFLDRETLYAKINARVDSMMEMGLLDEVRKLSDMGLTQEYTSMQAIGYKELYSALNGVCTVEDAVELIKLRSRRYAKRQISWCARYTDALRINWENTPDFDRAAQLSTKK